MGRKSFDRVMRLCFVLLVCVPFITFSQSYTGKLGYGVSPLGHPHDYTKFGEFLQEVAGQCGGGIVFANSAWRDSPATSGQIPNLQRTVAQLQPSPYAYTDMVNFGWMTGDSLLLAVPGNATNNWTNATARSLFLQMLINATDSFRPAYLFIGNEINFYWLKDSTDFLNWVSFYHQAYDSIKVHAPATKVGTIFNFEHLAGVAVLNGWTRSYWGALESFNLSKLDLVGVTLYPFLSYATANAVPLSYLDPLLNRIGTKPIAITETGWPGDSLVGPWQSSPAQQVDYVNTLFSMIVTKSVDVVNWLYLNYFMDTSTIDYKIFASIALRDSLGSDRPALATWLSKCNPATSVEATQEEANAVTLRVFPNPMSGSAVIQIGRELQGAELRLYNILGQEVRNLQNLRGTNILINRRNLPPGSYFYRIYEQARLLGSGKVVIK